MPFHDPELLLRQPSRLAENVLRYADLAHVVKQGRLLDKLHVLFVQPDGARKRRRILGDLLRMAESIVVLGIDRGGQGEDGGRILRIFAHL